MPFDKPVNILIPMAGEGSRFAKAGWVRPKPLIEVGGKAMIKWVVDNMDLGVESVFIFIIRTEHDKKYGITAELERLVPGCKIAYADVLTEGAACTTLLAGDLIDNDAPLVIVNSDQWMVWDSKAFGEAISKPGVDGCILTFTIPMERNDTKWSYAKVDENGIVTECAEKVVISDHASVGLYYWTRGDQYCKYAKQMIEKGIRHKGEFYVGPVYNESYADGLKHTIFDVDRMWGLGVPDDLEYFEANFLHQPAPTIRAMTCKYIEAFNSCDIEAVKACIAPQFVLEEPAGRFEGQATVLEFINEKLFKPNAGKLKFEAKSVIVDESKRMSVIEFELLLGDAKIVGTDVCTWSMDPLMLECRAYVDLKYVK